MQMIMRLFLWHFQTLFYSMSSDAGVKEPSMLLTSRVNSPFEVANKAFVFGHHLWQDHMACGTLDWGDLFIQEVCITKH